MKHHLHIDRDFELDVLNRALSREYNSLPAYILHSSPWTTNEDKDALEILQALRAQHQKCAAWITEQMRDVFRSGPTIRGFEYWTIDLNSLSLGYLLDFTRRHYERIIGEYEGILADRDYTDPLHPIVSRVLKETQGHLLEIENCIARREGRAEEMAALEPEEEEEDEVEEAPAEEEGERKVRTFKRPYGKPNYGKEPPKPVRVQPKSK
ncbi:MAG: hypothetical protein ACYTG4_04050 [Planctomycetota bacterium]|jgi:hypothetical protein